MIAAYNQGGLLQETVDSILKQTFRDWELVIVDDGSTDTTWDVSNQIVERNADRRIKILRKENGGLSDARNYGMRFAKGNWLCMLDSDDLLGKEYLSKAASLACRARISSSAAWRTSTRSRACGASRRATALLVSRTGTSSTPRS